MYKSIFFLLGKKRTRQMLLLVPVMLLGSLLEMMGLGIIVSVCALLVNDSLYENTVVLRVCGVLGVQPGDGLIVWILGALSALYLFKLVYLIWENCMVAKFARVSRGQVAMRLYRHIIKAPYSFFVKNGTAEVQNLLGRDTDQFGNGLSAFLQLTQEGIVALSVGVFLLLVDPVMTIYAISGLLVLLLLTRGVLYRGIRATAKRQRTANGERWRWLHQSVAGIKDIRIGEYESFFGDHVERAEVAFARADYLRQVWTKLPSLFIETVMVLSILAYLFYLTHRGEDLSHYLPGLSAMALAAVRLLPTCSRINYSLTQISYAKPSVEAICRAIKTMAPADAGGGRPQQEVSFTQGITLRDVAYAYEDGTEEVLRHVDMEIPAGTSVGIVGPSGAGKTTLLDVLLGLLPVERGQVLVDGVPIGECYESYLQKVAYVPQNTFLLDDTIRGNVAMGEEPDEVDDSRVWRALERAALAGTVRALPNGLDTRIGERGIRLSGGENQRLGLARAMYRDPSVIVFDEATSALDLDTEAAVLRSISQLQGEKTLIIVSHRLSAIEHCDRVYRVRDGQVLREK